MEEKAIVARGKLKKPPHSLDFFKHKEYKVKNE